MLGTEVIIIGGGLTGLITAKYLSKIGISYLVIEKYKLRKLSEGDLRTTAINYASCQTLQYLGLWDELEAKSGAINNICILNNLNQARLHFPSSLAKKLPMGYIVPNNCLKNALLDNLPPENIRDETAISDIRANDNSVTVVTNSGQTLTAKLLLVADGKVSDLKELLHIKEIKHDYKQRSYVFNISHTKPHNNLALEQFLPQGPLAFLPLADEYMSSVVYTKNIDMEQAMATKEAMQLDQTETEVLLNRIAEEYYGEITLYSEIKSFPLTLQYSLKFACNRLLFLGDSLHNIHPVAGQGLNLTMRDIEALVHLIHQYKTLGADIGGDLLLKRFKRARASDNMLMLLSTHALVKLFSNDNKLVNAARNLGLKLFGQSKLATSSAIAYAMGFKA